jgi:two-component system, OmpR family, phosphate regulon sensor histidine kinase PhoR
MKSVSYFPTRLFRWFLTQQIVFSAVLFVVLNGVLLLWVEQSGYPDDSISFGRQIVLVTTALCCLCFIAISLINARRFVVPLGRLIQKTRRMREFPFDETQVEPEVLTFDEPGEWFELERALNRLGRDLRIKTINLSREKTEVRTIMSAVSEAILAVNKERRVLFYNSHFAYLFNPIKLTGDDVRIAQLLRSPDVLEVYDAVLQTGQTQKREIQVAVVTERLPRVFELSVAPLKKKHNQEVYGAVGIFYDITEMKQADRIRIEFVGNVSHELRTPLTTINGYLQTLGADIKRGRLDEADNFLKILTQNVGRLKNLVEDLLDLSALESGKELKIEIIDLRELTETVLKQVNVRAHKVLINYEAEKLEADPMRLEQVLRNLLENGVRYVPEGKSIEVRWARAPGKVELRVIDNGPGIAPEHQDRLFERFYRIDEARSREKGGTGIGLSLVKHIVQRHGGSVNVLSAPGKGSEFICEFPDRII